MRNKRGRGEAGSSEAPYATGYGYLVYSYRSYYGW